MKISDVIKALELQMAREGDIEVIKLNTEYDAFDFATYSEDGSPAVITSDGSDFDLEFPTKMLVIY